MAALHELIPRNANDDTTMDNCRGRC